MLSSFEGVILLRSSVAQWWSNRLLTGRLAVRVRPEEPYITNKPSVPDRQGVVFVKGTGVRVAEGARLEIVYTDTPVSWVQIPPRPP
jgi:hypothetical protein